MTGERPNPDPLIPEGWESYTSEPKTDDSGRALTLVMAVVVAVLTLVVLALLAGWRP